MRKIKSFSINHDLLPIGLYLSRQDGDISTYDLRFKRPNAGDYLENAALHTLEHLIATYVRNSALASHVVYFGRWLPHRLLSAVKDSCLTGR